MPLEYIKKQQQKQLNFYTPSGLHVFFKEPLSNKNIDVEKVISRIESKIPHHLLSEVEMIIFGHFDEFDERSLNAFYDGGTLYVSNIQDDEDDLYDDLVHEISHSLESPHGYEIYGDEKVKDEFLRKRKHLHDILWASGIKAPMTFFMDAEYNKEFDMFLYEKVGYDKLATFMRGLFISPYAATSLREYFATGFTEYYLDSNHKFLQKVSPALYKKIILLQDAEALDN
tara:strand:+ start:2147 stop:2830 length:684 start_codon:yes stop_codon:yes gene_type:complete